MSAKFELRGYQSGLINGIRSAFVAGHRRVLAQLQTGGGKTVIFTRIAFDTLTKSDTARVLILTDRTELRMQAQNKSKGLGFRVSAIQSGERFDEGARLFVGMAQTIASRIDELKYLLKTVTLVIIDEAHEGIFQKLYPYFDKARVIGFTATPLSTKKNRLDKYYQALVCGSHTQELIDEGFLVPYRHFEPSGVHIKDLVKKRSGDGDFTDESQLMQLRTQTVYDGVKLAFNGVFEGKKTLVFCVNVEHANDTARMINGFGVACKVVTSQTPKGKGQNQRGGILKWFAQTPGSCLVNCGILTKGYDEPTIEHVICLRSIGPLTLYLQILGRGSRPSAGKTEFLFSDFGGNKEMHGRWDIERDWRSLFIFKEKPKKERDLGLLRVKICPKCSAECSEKAIMCRCGYRWPAEQSEVTIGATELIDSDESGLPKHLQISAAHMTVEQLIERAAIGNLSTGKAYSVGWIMHQLTKRHNFEEMLSHYAKLRGHDHRWVWQMKRIYNQRPAKIVV